MIGMDNNYDLGLDVFQLESYLNVGGFGDTLLGQIVTGSIGDAYSTLGISSYEMGMPDKRILDEIRDCFIKRLEKEKAFLCNKLRSLGATKLSGIVAITNMVAAVLGVDPTDGALSPILNFIVVWLKDKCPEAND